MKILKEHYFSTTSKLRMTQSEASFFDKAPVELIEITFAEQDGVHAPQEEPHASWVCSRTEYYHAKDRTLADKAFDERVANGGLKESSFAIPMFLDTLPNKDDL